MKITKIGNTLSTGITLLSLVVSLSILSSVISKKGHQLNLSNDECHVAPFMVSWREFINSKRFRTDIGARSRALTTTSSHKDKLKKLSTDDMSRIITLINDTTYTLNIEIMTDIMILFKTPCKSIPLSEFKMSDFFEESVNYNDDDKAYECITDPDGWLRMNNTLSFGDRSINIKTNMEDITSVRNPTLVVVDKMDEVPHIIQPSKIGKVSKVIRLGKGKIFFTTCDRDSYYTSDMVGHKNKCEKCNCSGPHIKGTSCSRGWCECEPGYTGMKCQEKCKFGRYGENCAEKCHCNKNALSCDHISGKCNCKAGLYGQQCEMASCICNGYNTVNGSCNSNGFCFCKPGYNGYKCDDQCKGGKYGQDCKKKVRCVRLNTESYNHINGSCVCKTGLEGQMCEKVIKCDAGKYRPRVSGEYSGYCIECNCMGANIVSQECSHNGFCKCAHGYNGKKCDKKCDGFFFGEDCTSRCRCKLNNTQSCHHVNGLCECKEGFGGKLCEEILEKSVMLNSDTNYEPRK